MATPIIPDSPLPVGRTNLNAAFVTTYADFTAAVAAAVTAMNSRAVSQLAGFVSRVVPTENKMLGMGLIITPNSSGRIFINIGGMVVAGSVDIMAIGRLRYGTGTPPVGGAAPIGTVIGTYCMAYANNISGYESYSHTGYVAGLTPGVPYWIDMIFDTLVSGTNAQVYVQDAMAIEI